MQTEAVIEAALKVSKENERITLELTYAEFEWANIEEFIVDIQLVRYDGAVSTFIKNALFEKKGQNFVKILSFSYCKKSILLL